MSVSRTSNTAPSRFKCNVVNSNSLSSPDLFCAGGGGGMAHHQQGRQKKSPGRGRSGGLVVGGMPSRLPFTVCPHRSACRFQQRGVGRAQCVNSERTNKSVSSVCFADQDSPLREQRNLDGQETLFSHKCQETKLSFLHLPPDHQSAISRSGVPSGVSSCDTTAVYDTE